MIQKDRSVPSVIRHKLQIMNCPFDHANSAMIAKLIYSVTLKKRDKKVFCLEWANGKVQIRLLASSKWYSYYKVLDQS